MGTSSYSKNNRTTKQTWNNNNIIRKRGKKEQQEEQEMKSIHCDGQAISRDIRLCVETTTDAITTNDRNSNQHKLRLEHTHTRA